MSSAGGPIEVNPANSLHRAVDACVDDLRGGEGRPLTDSEARDAYWFVAEGFWHSHGWDDLGDLDVLEVYACEREAELLYAGPETVVYNRPIGGLRSLLERHDDSNVVFSGLVLMQAAAKQHLDDLGLHLRADLVAPTSPGPLTVLLFHPYMWSRNSRTTQAGESV